MVTPPVITVKVKFPSLFYFVLDSFYFLFFLVGLGVFMVQTAVFVGISYSLFTLTIVIKHAYVLFVDGN